MVMVILSASVKRFSVSRVRDFCRTQEGPAYTSLFNFHTFVRPLVRPLVRPYVSEIKFWSLHIH